ncbi:MAG: SCO1664 family protein [Acidimicrobiales bacterium]
MPEDERLSAPEALTALASGQIELEGRLPWSSNGTFLVRCVSEGGVLPAVYKPHRGERPLWDFPGGLFRREVAAYQLSVALGWSLVPETLVREDAPLGSGSLQRFVPADFSQHYFTLLDDEARHDALRAIAVFDLLANNADRKAGHCLAGVDGRIWAIDHGLCFHPEPKLRTVIWDFAGDAIPARLLADLAPLAEGLPANLADLLAPEEARGVSARAAGLLERPRLPAPSPDRRPYPWPLV